MTNDYGLTLYPVSTPSGGELNLMSQEEADWYEKRSALYESQNKFTNISDLNDLDRVLLLEVMIQRWSYWLTQGFDYFSTRVNEDNLKDNIAEYSKELRLLKKALGMEKLQRDKDKGESVGDYIATLLARAKEFGVHRNKQYEKAVTLIYEIRALVMMYDRTDETEREDLDLSHETIMDFIRTKMVDEWDTIEAAFREEQRLWIREL